MKLRIRQILYILFAIAAFVLLIVVVTNSQSPESLMVPPEAAGDYKDIQDVIHSTVDGGIILKAPNEGTYTTAITFTDLNGDAHNDAIAFYRSKNDTSSIYMSVLIKNGSHWLASKPVKGKGNDVSEFSVGDLDYDSAPEIVVGWSMFDSKDNNALCVYSVDAAENQTTITTDDSAIYTKMFVEDICREGKKEILLVNNSYSDETAIAKATVFELEDKRLKARSSCDMLQEVMEYKQIQIQKVSGINVFYLDALIDSNKMTTEILYWDEVNNNLVNASSALSAESSPLRYGTVTSADINSDGIIEIPFSIYGNDTLTNITNWKQFELNGFRTVCQGVCSDDLIFVFPDKWVNQIQVEQNADTWSFYDISGYEKVKLFELVSCDLSSWKTIGNKYDKLKIDYGTIYGVRFASTKSGLALSKNEIKQAIINIR